MTSLLNFSEAQAVSICFAGSRLQSLACYALRVEGDLDCGGVTAGCIDVFGAHVGGRLWLSGAHLHSPDGGFALNAPDLTVGGGMYCSGVRAVGGVNMYGATIGSTLEFKGEMLSNPDGAALRAPGLRVRFDMDCSGAFTAIDRSASEIRQPAQHGSFTQHEEQLRRHLAAIEPSTSSLP